jgi:mRNA degradation ribonuclease J1/J2
MLLGENVAAGTRLIDGEGIEDYGTSEVMKDRLKMSSEGIFTVALAATGNYVINDPVVESHGFVFTENTGSEAEIKTIVQRAVESYDYENGNKDELANAVKKSLKNYFYKRTKQSPLIIVSVLDV